MYDGQSLIFRAAAQWSEATSLVVFAAGLLYLLQGFRFARFLLPVTCIGGGLVLGGIAIGMVGLPPLLAIGVAGGLGLLALLRYSVGLKLASAFTSGALAQYLAVQFGLMPDIVLVVAIAGLLAGFSLYWVFRRSLPIFVTMLQGACLLVVGFVGITSGLVPSLGLTFQDWAGRIPMMVPALLVMLCALGYSVQANAVRGDMEVGGSAGMGDPETS